MTKMRKPSAAEAAILNVLWTEQPCSVKTVHEILSRSKSVRYTTTLKQMQRLYEKGLVTRQPGEGKSYLYSAAVSEGETRGQLFDKFVATAFGNSVSDLVLHALGTSQPSADEIDEIKKLIEKLERE